MVAERARIARELHDVVGHSLSIVSLQAQAASAALDHDPQLLRAPLRAIGDAARSAMVEMRRLVAILDADDSPVPEAPVPSLRDLPSLVDEHRSAGLDVRLVMPRAPSDIPPGVQLAAYRIVQEGLTNVRRHTAAGQATVDLRFTPGLTQMEIVDGGPAVATDCPGGYGLSGVRARAASCGGWVEAGPSGVGWALRVGLPYDATPAP